MGTPAELLGVYVDRHNAGVRSGDFGPMIALFCDGSVVNFADLPSGRLVGRGAIAAVFARDPPGSELVLIRVADEGPHHVLAAYGWQDAPSEQAGWLLLQAVGHDQIDRLVITF